MVGVRQWPGAADLRSRGYDVNEGLVLMAGGAHFARAGSGGCFSNYD